MKIGHLIMLTQSNPASVLLGICEAALILGDRLFASKRTPVFVLSHLALIGGHQDNSGFAPAGQTDKFLANLISKTARPSAVQHDRARPMSVVGCGQPEWIDVRRRLT